MASVLFTAFKNGTHLIKGGIKEVTAADTALTACW